MCVKLCPQWLGKTTFGCSSVARGIEWGCRNSRIPMWQALSQVLIRCRAARNCVRVSISISFCIFTCVSTYRNPLRVDDAKRKMRYICLAGLPPFASRDSNLGWVVGGGWCAWGAWGAWCPWGAWRAWCAWGAVCLVCLVHIKTFPEGGNVSQAAAVRTRNSVRIHFC